MAVTFSEFVPGICCDHEWVKQFDRSETCMECGATCRRDADGKISLYQRPTVGMRQDEQRAVA